MRGNILEYKGYHTKIEFDADTCILHGRIEGIADLVDFECEDVNEVEQEFRNAVDDYLIFCDEVGKDPEKEYKGSFNVRITPELHRQLAFEAYKDEESLNTMVERAIQYFLLARTEAGEEKEKTACESA